MRGLILAHLVLLIVLGGITPLRAQFGGNDLINFGIQILNGAAQQPPAERRVPPPPGYQVQKPAKAPSRPRPASGADAGMIAEVQRRLNELGYPVGTVDGRAGRRTRQAIADFQRDHDMRATGQPDAGLLGALRMAADPAPAARTDPSAGIGLAGPSFDCGMARKAAERVICARPELGTLDRALANAYLAGAGSGTTSADAQRRWMARRDRCGGDTSCIVTAYRDRLSELGAAGASPAPSDLAAFALLEGYDLPEGDYRSGLSDPGLKGIGPEACRDLCADDDRCRGFTYNTGAKICILKDAVRQPAPFGGAVSGIKGGGRIQMAEELAGQAAMPSYADFVHLALMSDTDRYLAEAAMTGVAYVRATGTEQQCRELYDVAHQDEFVRRDYLEQAGARAREVIASLPTRPRRLEVPIEATYALADYDFDRQGFPFATYQQPRIPILAGGIVPLAGDKRTVFCNGSLNDLGAGGGDPVDFGGLGAEHAAVTGVDFLPMPEDQARAFRAAGDGKVLLKATLVVEPRDQGRGPLKGRIIRLTAHDPSSGQRLHGWDIDEVATSTAGPSDLQPWTGALLASLIGPTVEPHLDRGAFDAAAARYFSHHQSTINAGNPLPQSPLPMADLRGRQPEVVAALHRDRLRAVFHEDGPPLPIEVAAELDAGVFFEEGRGLRFNALENDIGAPDGQDPLSKLKLSSRDLPLYEQLPFLRPWNDAMRRGFREAVLSDQSMRIALELDRIVRLEPVAMGIEQAAERGLVGSAQRRDAVVVRWELDITGVRYERDAVILSASLRRLSYRWASDGAPIAEMAGAAFPTVAGLRRQAEEALPPAASADHLTPPPAGVRFGAEMADLLQLRFQPETVDDRIMERMMLTRFAYEAASGDETPLWGHFFRDFRTYLEPADRAARLDEFRAWSEARAAALPASLTISLPLSDTPAGKMAPFEHGGPHVYANACKSLGGAEDGTASEKQVAGAKLCGMLDAAWQAPDPLLYGANYTRDLRYNCDDDAYCAAMYNARVAMKLPHRRGEDIVELDRLPELDATVRAMTRQLVLEIEVEPTGASIRPSRPESVWTSALGKALSFDEAYGVGIMGRPDTGATEGSFVLFQARALSARVIDPDTGAVLAEPALLVPEAPAADMLVMPESRIGGMDVLGIRLGMSFAEADRLIRGHMRVGKILAADRKRQFGSVSGDIVPYTSGRLYASDKGDELIAIFDEPPAAPETVLGIWRILRLPRGGVDPAALRTTLAGRYGEPRAVKEVSLPFMNKGLAFLWFDNQHERCGVVDFGHQPGLWQGEDGDAAWLPPFMTKPYYPILGSNITLDVRDQPLPASSFCPAFLGVRYATYDGRNAEEPAGDELVTWLSDQRSYARSFHESRTAPAPEPPSDERAGAEIKF